MLARGLLAAVTLAVTGSPAAAQLAPPNGDGITFGHVHLNVTDLELHKRVWVDHFKGQWVAREPVEAVWLPGVLLMFNETEPTAGSQGSVMDHIGFKVRDYDGFLEQWRADGFEVQREFRGVEGNRNVYLLTPDGLRIELQEDATVDAPIVSHHVHWFAQDAEAALAHYTGAYGLRREPRGTIETTANVPGMNLSFSGVGRQFAGTRGRVIDHVGFEIDGLKDYVGTLQRLGVVFDVPYRELPQLGIAVAFYTDPAGVVVELTEGLRTYRDGRAP